MNDDDLEFYLRKFTATAPGRDFRARVLAAPGRRSFRRDLAIGWVLAGGVACVAGLGAWVSRETRHERLQSALSEPAVSEHVSMALEFLGPEAREYVLLALPEPEPVHAPWTLTEISRDSEVQP